MAIAYDTSATGGTGSAQTSITFTHTMSSSANRLLIVAVDNQSISDTVSGITYNSVAMTKFQFAGGAGIGGLSVWYLINPTTGANSVIVLGTSLYYAITASYTGVNQGSFPDATGTGSPGTAAATTSYNANTTTSADNSWVINCAVKGGGGAVSAGTNTTSRVVDPFNNAFIGDSNGVVHPAGTLATGWTAGVNNSWGASYFSIAPAAGGAPVNSNFLAFM